jgi:alkylhydroperoxidase family enzyme
MQQPSNEAGAGPHRGLPDEGALGTPRLAFHDALEADPYVASVFAPMRERGDGVPSLYQTLAHAPAMLHAWRGLAQPLLKECRSPAGVRELAILRIAQLLGCRYQWEHHLARAAAGGVTGAQLDAVEGWIFSDAFDEAERSVLAMADELTLRGALSRPVFDAARAHFDAEELVELSLTISFYNAVCRMVGALYEP